MGNPGALAIEQAWPQQEKQFADDVEQFVREQTAAQQAEMADNAQPRPARVPEAAVLHESERALTEVDNLNRYRRPDGNHSPWVLAETCKNLIPYVKEGGMPSAISDTYQEFVANHEDEDGRRHTFVWLGRTALQVARSGYAYHKHSAARARVGVEIEEARDDEQNLRPGSVKVRVSPHMSPADAPTEVAEAEHLHSHDALRISWLDVDDHGRIKGKHLQSLLVNDVPLEAWVAMLADPANIFGKSIVVENPESALSVMQVFRELELPHEALPEGLVTLLEAAAPYVQDESAHASLQKQIAEFREDQAGKHEKAANIARRWLEFEIALADSLHLQQATPDVEKFVNQLSKQWSDGDLQLIAAHRQPDGSLAMSRLLAARLEEAKRHFLLVSASVVTNNEQVIKQLDAPTAQRIRDNELQLQQLQATGAHNQAARLEAQNQQLIAAYADLIIEGGCPGRSRGGFRGGDLAKEGGENDRADWDISKGTCVVPSCPTRPGKVNVGPCGVCMDRCQRIYDRGGDPTKGLSFKQVIKPPTNQKKS